MMSPTRRAPNRSSCLGCCARGWRSDTTTRGCKEKSVFFFHSFPCFHFLVVCGASHHTWRGGKCGARLQHRGVCVVARRAFARAFSPASPLFIALLSPWRPSQTPVPMVLAAPPSTASAAARSAAEAAAVLCGLDRGGSTSSPRGGARGSFDLLVSVSVCVCVCAGMHTLLLGGGGRSQGGRFCVRRGAFCRAWQWLQRAPPPFPPTQVAPATDAALKRLSGLLAGEWTEREEGR